MKLFSLIALLTLGLSSFSHAAEIEETECPAMAESNKRSNPKPDHDALVRDLSKPKESSTVRK